jgi:hypothetical protein
MRVDLLTARRVLKAVREGLPVEETLMVVENLLDGFDDQEYWDHLDSMLKAAIQGETQWLEEMCAELKGRPSQTEKEDHHGR